MTLRIGTWNLAGRWDTRHATLLQNAHCDIWLLTEVDERLALPGYVTHATAENMRTRKAWAGVLTRLPFAPLPDPHPASAAVNIDGVTYCSSILPWRGCGAVPPWVGARHAEWTHHAVEQLAAALPPGPLVWGGDWNHALSGDEHAGSKAGRAHVAAFVQARGLQVPTADQPHHIAGLLSIDHISIPAAWQGTAHRVIAEADGARLSDHDAYVVELPTPGRS